MSDLRIQHARWQEELVSPDDPRLVSGKKCGCVCMGCGESLILRRGKKNRPHFAHHAETTCDEKCMIHNIVQAWVAQELPGKSIPLPPHPELDSPRRFLAYENKVQTEFSEGNRRYDVRLEGMFLYDFGVGDFNQDLAFKRYLEWSQKKTRTRVLQDSKLQEYLQWARKDPLLKALQVADYMEPRNYIHPDILKIVNRDELKGRTYEGGLRSDKLDHIMIEVEYSHAKDDDFKLQMKKERRYVLEVNAEKFYGNGRDLTPVKLIKNSEWVWPTDEQSKEQMSLSE